MISRPTDSRLLSRVLRWTLACLIGVALASCGGTDDKRPGQAELSAAEAPGDGEVPGRPTNLRGITEDTEFLDDERGGLTGPEYYRGSGVLARDAGREAVAVGENGRVTLNFANADIREVVDIVLGDTLNLGYIIDPAVQGTVTVRTSEPLARADVIPALENILALSGVAITEVDGTFMVVPRESASGLSSPAVSPSGRQLARGYGINIIPLRFVSASAMQEIVEPFLNPGSLRIDASRNLMIFSGSGSDTRDLLEMVDIFDVDWMGGMSFALFPVEVADVKSIVSDLETIFLQDGQTPLEGVVRFLPVERLNAVLAISPQPSYLNRAEIWIERLDRGLESAGRRIFVYYVENVRAVDLADILSQVFDVSVSGRRDEESGLLAPGLTPVELSTDEGVAAEGRAPAGAPTPRGERGLSGVGQAIGVLGGGSDVKIIADEATNALLVLSTAAEFRMIESTLKKLDVVPLQVLIEATIAEVSLDDTLRYGLQWFFQEGNFSSTFSTLSSGVVNAAFPGFSFLFDTSDARVVLNALTEVTDLKVISSPSLLVLDNQSARLQVGDQVPVSTQSSVSVTDPDAPVVNSIQLLDTGVVLEVTPRVNAGGLVVMEIIQEVSTAEQTVTSDIDSPTINTRRIESTVAIQSGNSIALGGLIQDSTEETVSGVPLLSDIPILGNLFKTTNEVESRTELLVLLTPRVVKNLTDAQEVTEELRKRLRSIQPLEQRIERQEGS